MSDLIQAVKNYDDAIDEYYSDGFYPGVSEQRIIDDLKFEVIKEAHNAVKEVKALKIIKEKEFNYDRFNYAIKYWKTTKEQVDVYNSGIGNYYKLTEEEFELLKEVLGNV